MTDREKVIRDLRYLKSFGRVSNNPQITEIAENAIALLEEQEDLGTELTNAIELIHKKNERIEKLLKEQEAVVRCKDCKRRETYECPVHVGCGGDGYDEPDDWFCADGEKGGKGE